MTGARRSLGRHGRQRAHGSIYRGASATKAAPKPKRSAHNVCDKRTGGCGHFRSDHRASQECRVAGCDCEVMVW